MSTEQSIAAFVESMAAKGFDREYVEDMVEEYHGTGEMTARDVETLSGRLFQRVYKTPTDGYVRRIDGVIREWCAAVGIDVPADMKGGE